MHSTIRFTCTCDWECGWVWGGELPQGFPLHVHSFRVKDSAPCIQPNLHCSSYFLWGWSGSLSCCNVGRLCLSNEVQQQKASAKVVAGMPSWYPKGARWAFASAPWTACHFACLVEWIDDAKSNWKPWCRRRKIYIYRKLRISTENRTISTVLAILLKTFSADWLRHAVSSHWRAPEADPSQWWRGSLLFCVPIRWFWICREHSTHSFQ